jgi:phosphoribosylanthranilate isomerase
MKTKIKICGITNLEDALDAIDAGVDALGFVFYEKSPRYITPENAKRIIAKLPPFVQSIGLFVNMTASEVDLICNLSKVNIAQIHFDADESLFDTLDVKYVKVVRAKEKSDILKYKDEYRIIDAFVESFGGEGKRLNLEWFKNIDCSKIILAGGLSSSNLKELDGYEFYGVDVSSGVESAKGKKDKQKMITFCKEANAIS